MLTEAKSHSWSMASAEAGGKELSVRHLSEMTSGSCALHSQLLINCMGQYLTCSSCSEIKVS